MTNDLELKIAEKPSKFSPVVAGIAGATVAAYSFLSTFDISRLSQEDCNFYMNTGAIAPFAFFSALTGASAYAAMNSTPIRAVAEAAKKYVSNKITKNEDEQYLARVLSDWKTKTGILLLALGASSYAFGISSQMPYSMPKPAAVQKIEQSLNTRALSRNTTFVTKHALSTRPFAFGITDPAMSGHPDLQEDTSVYRLADANGTFFMFYKHNGISSTISVRDSMGKPAFGRQINGLHQDWGFLGKDLVIVYQRCQQPLYVQGVIHDGTIITGLDVLNTLTRTPTAR